MFPATKQHTDGALVKALRARKRRVTPQRLMIHRALRGLNRHASAEEVFANVEGQLPNVSLPTVYSTLELLDELGLARRVGPVAGRMLFDPRLDEHHHLVCLRCGRVEDIDAPVETGPALEAARRRGYTRARAGLIVAGVCRDCSGAG